MEGLHGHMRWLQGPADPCVLMRSEDVKELKKGEVGYENKSEQLVIYI